MYVELPDEYYEHRDVVERFLRTQMPPAEVRRFWSDEPVDTRKVWQGLAGLGVQSLTVPETYGGAGRDVTATLLVLEVAGRCALPHPLADTIAVAAPALVAYFDADVTAETLAAIADGRALISVQDGWSGTAPWGGDADCVLVVDDRGISLCRPAPATTTLLAGVDPSRRLARVTHESEVFRLDDPEAATAVRDRAAIAYAAVLTGLGLAVIDQGVAYAKERTQFGRPIAQFQAVKHQLAHAYFAVESARRTVWFAAWCLTHRPDDVERATAMAKASVGEAAELASRVGLQVHGGIGYTWDCDLHLWLKRINVLNAAFGGYDQHWRALTSLVTPR